MLKVRYFFRLIGAFISRFKGIILLSAFLGSAGFFLIRALGPNLLGASTVRIGITGRFTPDSLPNNILEMVGDGLTQTDNAGDVTPNLSSSWESSEDGKTWTFHLKEASWQDGKRVTSQSIVYQFSDLTIDRPDANTLVFKLKTPYAPFPSVVSKPTFRKGLLGTGDWKVSKIILAAGNVQELDLKGKKGERTIYKFYPTEKQTKIAFKLGQVDKIEDIFSTSEFENWKTTKIEKEVDQTRYVVIFFNTQDNLLNGKNFRQALDYAINKDNFDGPRALGPISPDSWAYNPQVKPYSYDPTRAKELLSDLPKEMKANLTLKLSTTPVLLKDAEKIAKDWEEIGVKTTIQVVSGIPTDYQAFLAIFDTPKDPDQYAIWHSTQTSTNISHYQSPRIDKLLEDGRVELNQENRKKIYWDFQRFLVEDCPAVFIYHPTTYTMAR